MQKAHLGLLKWCVYGDTVGDLLQRMIMGIAAGGETKGCADTFIHTAAVLSAFLLGMLEQMQPLAL